MKDPKAIEAYARAAFRDGNEPALKLAAEMAGLKVESLRLQLQIDEENIPKPLTDAGNGERFAAQHRHTLRFDTAAGVWRMWNGVQWKADETGFAMQAAKRTARHIHNEAVNATHGVAQISKWAIASESAKNAASMLKWAQSEPHMSIVPSRWDADPWSLNTQFHTINLKTGEASVHNPVDLITKLAPIKYIPTADCPMFLGFLDHIFAGDAALIEYLQRFFGSCLTGDVRDQIMLVFYGVGANGKSTLLDTLSFILGDYCASAPPELLLAKQGDSHPTEVADLNGLRLVFASETEKGKHLRLQLIKRLTGDSTLKARFMRGDFFEFKRTFKLIMVTNNKPQVDEDSEAVWRRLKLVPFGVVIPKEERDPELSQKLRAEAPGILRWMIEGCTKWQQTGLTEPQSVIQATAGYRHESDVLGDFIGECCIIAPNAWTASETLMRVYKRFCEERGEKPIGGKDWQEALRKHGAEPSRRHAGRGWAKIGVTYPGNMESRSESVTPDDEEKLRY